jgi:hypothetical protein
MTNGNGTFGDVMVVGGGIAGIQAALDLATSGYKVYLVEKDPTIGGKMAQLDKTFPTNDCSMCIESPKFIECDRHPNIEILTYTEVEKHRDPDLYGSRHGRGRGRRLRGHPDQEAQIRQRRHLHGLYHLCGVLPGPHPRSVQSGAVGQQGDPYLLLPGRSAGPLHRRSLPLSAGREVLDLRRRL